LFKENGFGAFLIGEYFMKTQVPGPALEKFIQQI
jgi:indole-3-glycerol phosphate synthase